MISNGDLSLLNTPKSITIWYAHAEVTITNKQRSVAVEQVLNSYLLLLNSSRTASNGDLEGLLDCY